MDKLLRLLVGTSINSNNHPECKFVLTRDQIIHLYKQANLSFPEESKTEKLDDGKFEHTEYILTRKQLSEIIYKKKKPAGMLVIKKSMETDQSNGTATADAVTGQPADLQNEAASNIVGTPKSMRQRSMNEFVVRGAGDIFLQSRSTSSKATETSWQTQN